MGGNRFHTRLFTVLLAALAASATGCGIRNGHDGTADGGPGPSSAHTPDAATRSGNDRDRDRGSHKDAQPIELTDDLLQAYARGLEKEAEIIKRHGRAKPSHMGVYISRRNPDAECQEVLAAADMAADDYAAVAVAVDSVFDILSFQGKLEPRRSLDLERASQDLRRRMAGDPFDELTPESAAALRRNYARLAAPWSAINRQLAQFG